MAAAKSAKDEAQRIAAEVAKIEAATAAAAAKKATLLDTFSTLRGSWASRAQEQLSKEEAVVEAVKKLQRAARVQVTSASDEQEQ